MRNLSLFTFLLTFLLSCKAQSSQIFSTEEENWEVLFRKVNFHEGLIHAEAKEGEGLILHRGNQFENGIVEFDIKGTNDRGRSFVGFAFHYKGENNFDVIYFRPFNFNSIEKKGNAVQYISRPEHGWQLLRKNFPGKYENEAKPVPNPVDDWFHVKLIINHPNVEVYINGSADKTLQIDQLSDYKKGQFGFWVGHNSEGWFKNLSITRTK